jgi:hypothetical protein
MDQTATLWILGTMTTIVLFALGGIFAWIRTHSQHCSERHVEASREFGSISTKLDRVITDIGDHDSGLRGQVHGLANQISPLVIAEQMRREREK